MEPADGQVVDEMKREKGNPMADQTTTNDQPVPLGTPPKPAKSSAAKARAKLSDAAHAVSEEAGKTASTASKTVKQGAEKLSRQATDRARDYAEQGKAKASGALAEFARLMNDAAGSVDERLGEDYGGYARSAAQSLSGFADTLDTKDIDALLQDARNFVKKSPVVAVGMAAAIGFVLARLVKSGAGTDQDAT
jgi:ElaB/YqjD/DUF883 family membrane-anchored ribosome-binding protein